MDEMRERVWITAFCVAVRILRGLVRRRGFGFHEHGGNLHERSRPSLSFPHSPER